MQALAVAPAFHHAAGEFVDDDDLVVLDDVVDIAREQLVGAQGLVDVVDQADVLNVVEAALAEQAGVGEQRLDPLGALLGERDRTLLLVLVVVVLDQPGDQLVDVAIGLRAILGRAGDHQRRARLVDQDAVDLVDDGEVEVALDHAVERELHVVAQVVEAQLVVGRIGDVAGILGAPGDIVEAGHDDAHSEAQETVDPPHPLGIAPGEIVVDRDDVDALALDGIEIGRQGGDQGLALAGLHLRNPALVQDHAAQQLDVEMALAEHTPGRLAHGGIGLRQECVERFPAGQALAELVGPGGQRRIVESLELGLQGIDALDGLAQFLKLALVGRPEQPAGNGAKHL